jgi:hypothetical protein
LRYARWPKSRDPDARLEQLKMAEQFDRLARRAEAQEKKPGSEG